MWSQQIFRQSKGLDCDYSHTANTFICVKFCKILVENDPLLFRVGMAMSPGILYL